MTAVAMGAGMLPVALGAGADPSFRAPMAIVVIGGLLTSTVFFLRMIPVIDSIVDDAASLRRRPWFSLAAADATFRRQVRPHPARESPRRFCERQRRAAACSFHYSPRSGFSW